MTPTAAPAANRSPVWPWAVALIVLWGSAWLHLSREWSLNPQYQAGWLVPLLAFWMAAGRWGGVRGHGEGFPPGKARRFGPGLLALAVFGFFLGWVVDRLDPVWRLGGWLLNGAAVAGTLAWAVGVRGGAGMRALAFPLAFTFLAVPWPSFIEGPISRALMLWAAGGAEEALIWLGVPALQRGGVIELPEGLLGVGLACSGIQSLQASLLFGLFAGEYWRLGVRRRFVLLSAGILLAVAMNGVRVILLALASAKFGVVVVDETHDPVGLLSSLTLFLALLLVARRLAAGTGPVSPSPAAPSRFQGSPGGAWALGGVCAAFLAAWWWADSGSRLDKSVEPNPLWMASKASPLAGWTRETRPARPGELEVLRPSRYEAWRMRDPAGRMFQVVHLFWEPRASIPTLAFAHRPDICLPSTGWRPLAQPRDLAVSLPGGEVTGTVFQFGLDLHQVGVFQVVWSGGLNLNPGEVNPTFLARFFHLWTGPIRQGQEMVVCYFPEQVVARPETLPLRLAELWEQGLQPVQDP